ncbi:HD-GYP domain [Alteromonadaceae bacterium Bs31]|nr:HD-GYP domain [Alteromonadaceae bacterium Bs31]
MELDQETRHELMDAFKDLHREAELAISKLLRGTVEETKHELFRAIHNIKGNAGMMRLDLIVTFTHDLEEVVGALRRGKLLITEPLAEILLIGLDRLHDLHEKELFGVELETLSIDQLITIYQALAASSQQEAEQLAAKALQSLGAGVTAPSTQQTEEPLQEQQAPPQSDGSKNTLADLVFFQELAFELDNQIPHWQGRSAQLFDWAMKMNQLADSSIDNDQLAAGIYMHDFGMSLVDRSLWEHSTEQAPPENSPLFNHPRWSYEYLKRIPAWQEAAVIALHHHEYINGSGFPNRLKGEAIHPGAKILAILDNFFLLSKGRVDCSDRKSTVRAVSAINSRIDTHFEGMWVQCFNHIIRNELRSGNL